ncbi:MAG: hypothetical protein E3J83_03480 [Candidatus Atribacteria bacterium]|nr:MAG: hypothetical protein E3J83_03480 [Candidatus Atribacteria bacterium]
MTQTIKKSLGEGFSRGEIYAALAYDTTDRFGGMRIKGIYVAPPSGSGDAIQIGSCTNGIKIEGTVTLPIGIGTVTALTTAVTGQSAIKVYSDLSGDGYNVPVWITGAVTGAGASFGSIYCIRGDVKLTGVQTTQDNDQFVVGVHGRARVSGTIKNTAVTIAGVMSQILAGGTWTEVENACSLWVDNQLATNPTTGEVSMVLITQNNSSSSAIVDNVFKVQGGGGTDTHFAYLFNFVKNITGGFVSADIGSTAIHKTICRSLKIKIDDVDFYLLASTAPATS